jgi:hypothetical protein
MPRPRRWRIPIPVLGTATNRQRARDERPTEIARAYLKEALGRRKKRTAAKAMRAAQLYQIDRDIASSHEQQARIRWQDAAAHDWQKAHDTIGVPPYGVVQENPDNISDALDVLP